MRSDKGYDQRQVTLTAPGAPGDYTLRYWNGDNSSLLHEQPLKVTAVEVALDPPASAPAGQYVTITWTGPGARYDEIQVWDPAARAGRGQSLANKRVQSDKGYDQRQVTIKLPDVPGNYELRYWNGDNQQLLHSQPFRVE